MGFGYYNQQKLSKIGTIFTPMSKPKFIQPSLNFTQELKKRINSYFEDNQINKTGNAKLFSKAIILLSLLAIVYVHLVFFTPATMWAIVSAIGFNVMHDGGHGSFSENKVWNRVAAHSLDLLGGSSYMWHMKHNIIHHTYTNVEGVDDDINVEPWLRFAPSQKLRSMHKYQHLYFWFFYSLLYFSWIFIGDFKKYFHKKIGSIDIPTMKAEDHTSFWMSKVSFVSIFMIIPMWHLGFLPWFTGFALFLTFTGLLISIVFQLAHTVEHTDFVQATETVNADIIENEWTIHQLETTANFATKNKIVNWFTGGLNFQVEHHLFPKISHVHYPAISKIIKEVCAEYDVRYNEFKRTRDAILSHLRYLKQMGVA
jgi:linoleoyl-CoA desaturase